MFSKCPVSVSAPDTGSGRPWHKLWWWPSSHHSPAHYTRYWQCRGLLLHWNIYPRPDSTKRNWIRSLDFDDIQYPSVINNAGVDGCACDRNGKWMQIFFALSAASLAASPVTSGQVLTPAPASHSSLRRSLLSCQLVTGQERRLLESPPNRFDHNGNKVGFPGHELMLSWSNMNVKLLVSLVMTLGLTQALEIESLAVPPILVSGDSAVMSCYYTLPDTRLPELDIKWYHGASPSPFMVSWSWFVMLHVRQ